MTKEFNLSEKIFEEKYKLLLKDWAELGKRYWQLEVKFKYFLEKKKYDESLKILNKKVNDIKENQKLVIDCINLLGNKIDKLAGAELLK